MGHKIMVAFDESENARRAVEYIAQVFPRDAEITLFSVLQDSAAICEMNSPELTPYFRSQQNAFCALEDKKRGVVSGAGQNAITFLIESGFQKELVSLKIENKKNNIAKDIVEEARSGYDLVVLGRRGLSGIKDYFLGSISQKVLHMAPEVSLLFVS
ncbi:MAG: universal stress protein [Desulfobacterales bacterium]|jgi:nucleotide-binding universal stress UspA family protein